MYKDTHTHTHTHTQNPKRIDQRNGIFTYFSLGVHFLWETWKFLSDLRSSSTSIQGAPCPVMNWLWINTISALVFSNHFLSFLCAVIWNFARLFTSSFVLSCFSCKPSFLPNVIGGFLFTHYFLPLLQNIGEGNGNLLQYSCLENPMDEGAW